MQSILKFFDETKELEQLSEGSRKRNKYIKNFNALPPLNCPEMGSKRYDRDIEMVKWYYDNKSLSSNFLTKSDESVKNLFKMFCKENNISINWKFIKEVLKDVYSIVNSLKNKHKRPRPKNYLLTEDNKYKDIINYNSFSFPSGHTTTAHFLCEVIAHFYPSARGDLKNLADMIGHSRIENCVHYPSDVLMGQMIGEIMAQLLVSEKDTECHLSFLKMKKKDKKKLVSQLKKIPDIQDYFSEYLEYVCADSTSSSSKNFLKGYPVDKCSKNKNVKDVLNLLVLNHKLDHEKIIFDFINMNKIMNSQSNFEPGSIRHFEIADPYFGYTKPKDIINHIDKLNSSDLNPYYKCILFDCISPFCYGNKEIAIVSLLSDLNYDFEKCNKFLSNYDQVLSKFKQNYGDIYKVFK